MRHNTPWLFPAGASILPPPDPSSLVHSLHAVQGPYLQDPMQAGLQLIPFGLGILLAGPWAGMAADRIGVRSLLVAGVLVQLASVIGLAYIQPDTNYWLIAFALLVAGVAQGK
jgi:MFS family permease